MFKDEHDFTNVWRCKRVWKGLKIYVGFANVCIYKWNKLLQIYEYTSGLTNVWRCEQGNKFMKSGLTKLLNEFIKIRVGFFLGRVVETIPPSATAVGLLSNHKWLWERYGSWSSHHPKSWWFIMQWSSIRGTHIFRVGISVGKSPALRMLIISRLLVSFMLL